MRCLVPWRCGAPVAPPPIPPAHPAALLLFWWWVFSSLLLLVQFLRGSFGHLQPRHAMLAWPFSMGSMVLGHISLGFYAPRILLPSATDDGLSHGETMRDAFVFMMPIVAFGLLLISEFALWLFARMVSGGRFGFLRQPIMAVHGSTLLYYLFEPLRRTRGWVDIFGRPLYPMRHVMWTCSVTCMLCTLYYVVRNTLTQAKAPAKQLHRLHVELAVALLFTVACFFFGLLMSAPMEMLPGYAPNVIAGVCSLGAFYVMLYCVHAMLNHTKRIVPPSVAQQFTIIRYTILLVWHVFPAVWFLAAADLISVTEEQSLYILADVLAKYLMLFVCIQNIKQ